MRRCILGKAGSRRAIGELLSGGYIHRVSSMIIGPYFLKPVQTLVTTYQDCCIQIYSQHECGIIMLIKASIVAFMKTVPRLELCIHRGLRLCRLSKLPQL